MFRVGPSSSRPPSPAKRRWGSRRPIGTCTFPPQNLMRSQQELERSLDFAKVPKREKAEVLAAFADHKDEVTAGYVAAAKPR